MEETRTKIKANIAIVYRGNLEDFQKVCDFIENEGGSVIFIKKSVGKLRIVAESDY